MYIFTLIKPEIALTEKTLQITVTGLVQGVGFRPFVFRIANRFGLTGWVQNTNENVIIQVTGTPQNINSFLVCLKADAPSAAIIRDISILEIETKPFAKFSITVSNDVSEGITEISPDIAVCDECLSDMDRHGTRFNYAFVNCTNCGPRFTIIKDLPYDREKTTMRIFTMCPQCLSEYINVTDRRFHAQPVACSACGPNYELFENGRLISSEAGNIIDAVTKCIDNAGVALIKGLGGMHLACDAFNEAAVEKLRDLKNRDGKPFAVMFRDLESLIPYVEIENREEQSILSWRRPIVLLRKKKITRSPQIADRISSGLNLLGVMLPYMPFHYLLFRKLKTSAIVLTSGNFSSEPILTENIKALDQFSKYADVIVLHNRDIFNRTDDSVVRVIDAKERILRRSRGYVPSPVHTALNTDGIIAFGAELTNCFCVGKQRNAYLSQHIGDLQGIETIQFYDQTIAQFIKLFRIKPSLIAIDMHPSYISSKSGHTFADLPIVEVQHHHAHIASCMAENMLDEKVIGVALDGTGYGTDGNTWGSEFLLCSLNDFERVTHFEYIPLPGGDSATEEPWRIALSYLYKVFGNSFHEYKLSFLEKINTEKIRMIIQMIDKKINCPLTSGAGRLFDCVASLLDLVQTATFQAEGPMRLESIVRNDCSESYRYTIGPTICFDATIRGIVEDIGKGTEKVTIATKFHNTIILAIFDSVNAMRLKSGINKVVLSGGVFQNKYLSERTMDLLRKNNFEVYSHATVPANDGGIALGQLAVASKRRELLCVWPFLQK
jgi:hydrogenase maturation protein HypF